MNHVFVVTHSQIGQLETRGAITGNRYLIDRTGNWVDERDWPEMQRLEKHLCCPPKVVQAFGLGRASVKDMKRKPTVSPKLVVTVAPKRKRRKSTKAKVGITEE
jgi:hypothetical protein